MKQKNKKRRGKNARTHTHTQAHAHTAHSTKARTFPAPMNCAAFAVLLPRCRVKKKVSTANVNPNWSNICLHRNSRRRVCPEHIKRRTWSLAMTTVTRVVLAHLSCCMIDVPQYPIPLQSQPLTHSHVGVYSLLPLSLPLSSALIPLPTLTAYHHKLSVLKTRQQGARKDKTVMACHAQMKEAVSRKGSAKSKPPSMQNARTQHSTAQHSTSQNNSAVQHLDAWRCAAS